MHDLIKARMASTVPFLSYVGIEILEVAAGRAVAALEQRQDTSNHLSTIHAGALFTLG
jgi:acyl-coenzyme A thioesterase PaaI-like protein